MSKQRPLLKRQDSPLLLSHAAVARAAEFENVQISAVLSSDGLESSLDSLGSGTFHDDSSDDGTDRESTRSFFSEKTPKNKQTVTSEKDGRKQTLETPMGAAKKPKYSYSGRRPSARKLIPKTPPGSKRLNSTAIGGVSANMLFNVTLSPIPGEINLTVASSEGSIFYNADDSFSELETPMAEPLSDDRAPVVISVASIKENDLERLRVEGFKIRSSTPISPLTEDGARSKLAEVSLSVINSVQNLDSNGSAVLGNTFPDQRVTQDSNVGEAGDSDNWLNDALGQMKPKAGEKQSNDDVIMKRRNDDIIIIEGTTAEAGTRRGTSVITLPKSCVQTSGKQIGNDVIVETTAAQTSGKVIGNDVIVKTTAAQTSGKQIGNDDVIVEITAAQTSGKQIGNDVIVKTTAAQTSGKQIANDVIMKTTAAQTSGKQIANDVIVKTTAVQTSGKQINDDVIGQVTVQGKQNSEVVGGETVEHTRKLSDSSIMLRELATLTKDDMDALYGRKVQPTSNDNRVNQNGPSKAASSVVNVPTKRFVDREWHPLNSIRNRNKEFVLTVESPTKAVVAKSKQAIRVDKENNLVYGKTKSVSSVSKGESKTTCPSVDVRSVKKQKVNTGSSKTADCQLQSVKNENAYYVMKKTETFAKFPTKTVKRVYIKPKVEPLAPIVEVMGNSGFYKVQPGKRAEPGGKKGAKKSKCLIFSDTSDDDDKENAIENSGCKVGNKKVETSVKSKANGGIPEDKNGLDGKSKPKGIGNAEPDVKSVSLYEWVKEKQSEGVRMKAGTWTQSRMPDTRCTDAKQSSELCFLSMSCGGLDAECTSPTKMAVNKRGRPDFSKLALSRDFLTLD